MPQIPRVTCSVAMSLDGRIDHCATPRLRLSSEEDGAAIDRLRASQDAILVGAGTLRRDNPKLLVKSQELRQHRTATARNPDPIKVTVTRSGQLRSDFNFFTSGTAERLVYCPEPVYAELTEKLHSTATIISCSGDSVDPGFLLQDLHRLGIRNLLIEGGEAVHTMFLQAGLVNRLRVAIAPFFVGQAGAPGFVSTGLFPFNGNNRLRLESAEQLGDMAVMHYCVPT